MLPPLTVVVPTFNEGANVPRLLEQLGRALAGRQAHVLFVDDSTDTTPDTIRAEVDRHPDLVVDLIHREGPQRTGGLAGAVVAGIRAARHDVIVVMDGDLQHPPALVPVLAAPVAGGEVDVCVASRYCGSGDASGLSSSWRHAASSTSTRLARALFPRRVGATCTDPMTGFFCLRRSAVDLGLLRPRGFKILLEVLASHDLRVEEVPFVFGERYAGQSKASWRNGLHFLHQLASLRATPAMRFAGVGALGFVVNLVAMAVLLGLGLHYVAASIIATELAIAHNFLMQERFVFSPHLGGPAPHHGWWQRAWRSVLYNNADNFLRVPLLVLLVERLHMASLPAQALTLVGSFALRYLYTARVVYRPATVPVARAGSPKQSEADAAPAARPVGPTPRRGRGGVTTPDRTALADPTRRPAARHHGPIDALYFKAKNGPALRGIAAAKAGLAAGYWQVVYFDGSTGASQQLEPLLKTYGFELTDTVTLTNKRGKDVYRIWQRFH